jgi:hypothetical protein
VVELAYEKSSLVVPAIRKGKIFVGDGVVQHCGGSGMPGEMINDKIAFAVVVIVIIVAVLGLCG